MKKILILTVVTILSTSPAWSQATTTTPAPNTHGELWEKLKAMTPEERQEFLRTHPEIRERVRAGMIRRYENMSPEQKQQFLQTHPEFAKRVADAKEAGAGVRDPGHPRVNEVSQREKFQQQRINQGVKSGALTPEEAAILEKDEAKIQNEEAKDFAKNNGHLTPAEQRRLNVEQNRESHRINKGKHN